MNRPYQAFTVAWLLPVLWSCGGTGAGTDTDTGNPSDVQADVVLDAIVEMIAEVTTDTPTNEVPDIYPDGTHDAPTDVPLDMEDLEPLPPECAYCQPPMPACKHLNGAWVCVECTDDSYCPEGQICDTTIFACVLDGIFDPIPPCRGSCIHDSECVSLSGTFDLACNVPSGCCYDLAGSCDGIEATCLSGECESILEIVGGGIPIPLPEGLLFAHCTCEQPIDTSMLLTCLQVGSCPSGDCPSEAVCLDVDDLISWVAQPEGWPPDFPGMCIGVDVLLQSFLPGD